MSVGPRSKNFEITSNNHGRTQKWDFCGSVCKTNFTDHHTPDTIHGFRILVLVCKMRDCYCTQKFRAFLFLPIRRCKRLQCRMKSNHFKMLSNVFSTTYAYSNCIVYRLFYCWKNYLTNICTKISKTGMNLWMVYRCNIKSSGKHLRKMGKTWMYFASLTEIMRHSWLKAFSW